MGLHARVARVGAGQDDVAHERRIGPDLRGFGERLGHQQEPVTVEGIPFGAEKRDAIPLAPPQHPVEPLGEGRFPTKAVEPDAAVRAVVGWIVRPAAELPTQEDVLDAPVAKASSERLAAELRTSAAVRRRTHIGDGSHLVALQQLDEVPDGVGGMADCQDDPASRVHPLPRPARGIAGSSPRAMSSNGLSDRIGNQEEQFAGPASALRVPHATAGTGTSLWRPAQRGAEIA